MVRRPKSVSPDVASTPETVPFARPRLPLSAPEPLLSGVTATAKEPAAPAVSEVKRI
ncbi:hypothetical protein D3C72_2361810 [compost metagenome]